MVVDNRRYEINTSFKVALRCLRITEDDDISDYERAMAVVYLLFGDIPENNIVCLKLLHLGKKYLQHGETDEEQQSREADMDFEQDEGYIYSSFMSDYHIDLNTTDMHWWAFLDLIQGLTDKCSLSRVREIRNYDLSEIKDNKTRNEIIRAKERVKLKKKYTKEEQQAIDAFEAALKGGSDSDG